MIKQGRYRVAVDTGGTFCDFAFLNEETGQISVAKIPSTPWDPSEAIFAGVQELIDAGVAPKDIVFFSHGTTVGTNALLEEKGARTGLIITEGFRAIYEVREQMRGYGPAAFNFFFDKPPMLVPQSQTYEVGERLDFRGQVIRQLDVESVSRAAQALKQQNIESVAVCLLYSFRNPAHEKQIHDILREICPATFVSLSSNILPQIREYYRLSTTVINAYLGPVLHRYVSRLDGRLSTAGINTSQRYIMQSNGGVSTFESIVNKAVNTVLSGPAGGVIAGVAIGRSAGYENIITFDMGGTSCDVALIQNANPSLSSLSKINGQDIAVPMLDINTVSAGGGTIARTERVGDTFVLKVGPDSAGSSPGPVAYGKGGELPTVTDANLVLGFLNPAGRLAGRVSLGLDRARGAIEERVAGPLGMSVETAAGGVFDIINVKMEEAIKAISSKRGFDLRQFALIAFGGAGPIHAGQVAKDLGIPTVIVPPHPGVTSALGLLMTDVKHDYVFSQLDSLANVELATVVQVFQDLEKEAANDLQREGFQPSQILTERYVEMRYAGQGYEVRVPVPGGEFKPELLPELRRAFDDLHEQLYGHRAEQEPAEIVNYRVIGLGLVPKVEMARVEKATYATSKAEVGCRQVYFSELGTEKPSTIYAREQLRCGHIVEGPAIVEQLDSTVVIYPEQQARVDEFGNLIISSRS